MFYSFCSFQYKFSKNVDFFRFSINRFVIIKGSQKGLYALVRSVT